MQSIFNFEKVNESLSEHLTAEMILEKISPYDIFNHYIDNLEIGKLIHSPIRIDNKPSFGVYVNKYNGDLRFNDFYEGGGNCFEFVKKKYRCTYKEALHVINRDFNLKLTSSTSFELSQTLNNIAKKPVVTNYVPKPKSSVKIKVITRNWLQRDFDYWYLKYHISFKTLEKFDVYPITAFWMGLQRFYVNQLAYAYFFDPGVFKIYQPLLEVGQGKWYTNLDVDTKWHGYKQLPETGDILFITKSLKDVMVLDEIGYNAISPHNETPNIPDKVIENLKKRFKKIYVYYDNDKTGVMNSTKICNRYGFDYVNNPSEYPKDPSDFIELYGEEKLKVLINELLEKKN